MAEFMNNNDIINIDNEYIANTYNRYSIALSSGHGATATDLDGKKYIDFSSGIGTNSLGFCNYDWINAVTMQLNELQHTSNLFYTLPDALLARKLCQSTGYSKCFFCNSGAEANEGAIKIARKYGQDNKGADCYNIITLENSFHGRTITTLAATGQDVFHNYFQPFTPGFKYVPANDKENLTNSIDSSVCAIMIELVQGEGGVVVLDKEYVKYVEQICKENNILLIVDEVQTGIGRTGTFLCCEQYDIQPDIITLAKGLGAGLPIGAILMNQKTEKVFGIGQHGSTFGGNPVVCAGAIEVVRKVTDKDFLSDIVQKGLYLKEHLLSLPNVTNVSGIGLMLGISLRENLDAHKIAEKCVENGLLVLTAKNKLRLLPPLNITIDEINSGLKILEQLLN